MLAYRNCRPKFQEPMMDRKKMRLALKLSSSELCIMMGLVELYKRILPVGSKGWTLFKPPVDGGCWTCPLRGLVGISDGISLTLSPYINLRHFSTNVPFKYLKWFIKNTVCILTLSPLSNGLGCTWDGLHWRIQRHKSTQNTPYTVKNKNKISWL